MKLIVSLVTFFVGFAVSFIILTNYSSVLAGRKTAESVSVYQETTPTPTPAIEPIDQLEDTNGTPSSKTSKSVSSPSSPSSKLTIQESKHLTVDKVNVETGVQVWFSVALKNTGSSKKFLTHICFKHSGGVTFGCILNKNLETGEEFSFGNGMKFPTPGSYTVWVEWSQDGTLFYKPLNATSVTVHVN